jgi:hypothetical protein
MILLEDETMNLGELFKPSNELPQKFSLWLHDEAPRCEKVAKEYAASMRRPKYLPLYEMTCFKVDMIERKPVDPQKVEVELTDEEYVYLLTRALLYGTTYRFSHLRQENPALAQKVFTQAIAGYPDDLKSDGAIYQIAFSEMHENAKEIIQLKNYFFPGDLNKSRIFI